MPARPVNVSARPGAIVRRAYGPYLLVVYFFVLEYYVSVCLPLIQQVRHTADEAEYERKH